MDRKRPEESKKVPSRKSIKKKAPVVDARKSLQAGADAPTAIITEKPKTSRDRDLIINALSKHFIFTSLSEENRETLIDQMKLYNVGPREIIFQQGQPGNNFFVIANGQLQVLVNRNCVKELTSGDSFGELALLHDSCRSATILTTQRTALWGLDRKTFRSALETVNAQNYQETRAFIESVPVFQVLSSSQRESLIASLSTLKFRAQEKIVNEGDPGGLFYLITDGVVSCTQEGREIRKMYPGEYFGEQALLYNSPRTASVFALEDVKCLAVGRDRLKKVLGSQLQQILYRNSIRMAFERSQFLSNFNRDQVQDIIQNMKVQTYLQGQVVIPAGTPKGQKVWVVVKGTLMEGSSVAAGVFNCIGEEDLQKQGPGFFPIDLVAGSEEVDVAEASKEDLERNLTGSFEQAKLLNQAFLVMKRVQVFVRLPEVKLRELIGAMQLVEFKAGNVIFEQDSPGDSFFIVNEGKVDVLRNGEYLRTITKLDYFGERSMLFNDRRSATVVANTDLTCWMLLREDFSRLIDESVRIQLMDRIELQDISVTLEELSIVKTLGKGMFGNVFLVVHKNKQRLYALKTVDRPKIDRYEIHENLVLERKILLQLDHHLIMKLVRTFKDEFRVYFLLEFVGGLDLFDVLRKLGLVSENDSRFYTACLIEILEHLHERDIIYRDLKPENVMVDEAGYPKLIDFGTAKIVDGRTFTIVGTPHYMAPEVIVGKGYNVAADYWSLGIMLYEFLCGGVPFGEEEEDPYIIYEKVLERKLVYTNYMNPKCTAKPLIEQLLSKNPAMRTGGSIEDLKKHEWFANFDWYSIFTRQMRTPYKPKVSNLTRAVQLALMQGGDMNETIRKEEMMDEMSSQNYQRRNANPGWDADF